MKASIKFAKCNDNAQIPERVPGSAGMDVYACFDEEYIEFEAHETKLIPTGIKSAIDKNYFVLLAERGSTGSKGMKRGAGVIDADYLGQWFVCITNDNNKPLFISKLSNEETRKEAYPDYFEQTSEDAIICYPYERAIAQALVLPVPTLEVTEISDDEISRLSSRRGTGALGSSGK